MLTVIYDAINGTAVTDGNAETYVKNVLGSGVEQVTVGNEVVINAFRVMVARGVVQSNDIRFMIRDVIITLSPSGRLSACPEGFCDVNLDLMCEL